MISYHYAFIRPANYILAMKGYFDPVPPRGIHLVKEANGSDSPVPDRHAFTTWYERLTAWRARLFENEFWPWPVPIGGLVAALMAWRSRGRAPGAVAVLVLVASVAGVALGCGMVSHLEARYAYSTEFVNYLLLALLPVAWAPVRRSAMAEEPCT